MKMRLMLGGIPLVALLVLLAGCGTNTGSGADGGTWATSPARNTTAAVDRPTEEMPNTTLLVLLRGKSAEETPLDLNLTQLDVKVKDRWVAVAKKDDLAKLEKMPLRIGPKGAFALLANTTTFPKRKYSHLRLVFDDKKTVLLRGDKKLPLVVQTTTLELNDWMPDEKAINLLTLTVDGTQVTTAETSATLPAGALTVAPGAPTAGVSGKIVSPNPAAARVTAYWGAGKVALGDAIPDARTGEFQINKLPAGRYRVDITAQGYKEIEPRKDPVVLEDKVLPLGDLQLAKETE